MKAALAALVAAACGGGDAAIDPFALPVDEPGPFRVGYRTWPVSYAPPGGAPERMIDVHMWYPTEDAEGVEVWYEDLFRDYESFLDAAPAAPIHGGAYPVHAFSHGFRGFPGNSAFLMRHFASHGWVAVAPSHTGNTLFDTDPLPPAHYFERSADVAAALDALAGAELPGEPLTDAVLLSGHSFGAYTAWATAGAAFDEAEVRSRCAGELDGGTCTEAEIAVLVAGLDDPRVVAAIPMAGGDTGWFGAGGYAAVEEPVFYMTGTDDDVGQQALYDLVGGVDLTWIDVEGGCHQMFAVGACDSIDTEVGFAIVRTYALAFARRHVLGDADATIAGILDGSIPVSDLVHYMRK
jgi:predicted dienelactone hydrolase